VANVMLYGANRPHNVALVVLDVESVENWAKQQGLSAESLEKSPEVEQLIESELAKYGAEFRNYERPKRVVLIREDFTHENNMLTPSMKLKRRYVLEKYQAALDGLY
jgi:long-chain acyl-CoA synthetase